MENQEIYKEHYHSPVRVWLLQRKVEKLAINAGISPDVLVSLFGDMAEKNLLKIIANPMVLNKFTKSVGKYSANQKLS